MTLMTENRLSVMGIETVVGDVDGVADEVVRRAGAREGGHVVQCNVHVLMTAGREPDVARALESAWLVVPDGAPVAWLQRRLGAGSARRVGGPDLMELVLDRGRDAGLRHAFVGSTPETLEALRRRLASRYPDLEIAGMLAPPFDDPSTWTEQAIETIRSWNAHVVWLALGAPKQELWMGRHAQALAPSVVIGVGAAFDFHAAVRSRAPQWMQRCGLEWLHRLGSEPRRLTARYATTNRAFVAQVGVELTRRVVHAHRLRRVPTRASRVLEMIGAYENWPTALVHRAGAARRGRAVTYRFRRGPRMTVASGVHDVRVLNEVLIEQIYERRPDFTPRDGWQIVDGGAHKGSFSILTALGRPSVSVVACEPAPTNYAYLCHNVAQNGCSNIVPHRVAISGRHGTARLHFEADASGHGGLGQSGDIEVETRTLTEILDGLDGTIHLLKLDIEGAELDALRATDTDSLERVQRIVLEYHESAGLSQETAGAVLGQLLANRGYHVELADDRPFLWAWRQGRG
jgi:N-acetylglucosaminyldiphosphoundecaprenol N-acetyl-beta-D-mannosaminyltransferase